MTSSVQVLDSKAAAFFEVKGLKQHFPIHQGFFQKVVGHVKAVDGVDLFIRENEALGLVGESGCGKSLTAMSLMGLLPRKARQSAGRFALMGTDYAGKAPKACA